jgi:hypothetical protein
MGFEYRRFDDGFGKTRFAEHPNALSGFAARKIDLPN